MREPVVRAIDVGGLMLAAHEWPGDSDPIVLIHATGLCARTWDPVVSGLPEGARVVALDLRGHGLSQCPEPIEERFHWPQFGEDIAGAIEALDLTNVTLVGHSMGGHSATVAALEAPDRIMRLVLLDPTLTAPAAPGAPSRPPASEQPSRKRRNEWASPEAFFENLRGKPPFASWDERALWAYAKHGLRHVNEGEDGDGYVLACPPLFEASIYAGNRSAYVDEALPRITAPVFVVRAHPRTAADPPGLGPSATRPEVLDLFQDVTDRQLPEAGHFFPQETPELAARAILEAMR